MSKAGTKASKKVKNKSTKPLIKTAKVLKLKAKVSVRPAQAKKLVASKIEKSGKSLTGKAVILAQALAAKVAATNKVALTKRKGTKGAVPVEPAKPLTKAQLKAQAKAQALAAAQAAAHAAEEEIVLTNADGKQYCRVHDCDNEATTEGHCRLHYLALWKRNRIKAKILQGGKLDKYIEDLTAKYPDKYLEILRKDLSSEKDFNLIVAEMDMEDSSEEAEQEEDTSRFIEEVRGGIPTPEDDEGSF